MASLLRDPVIRRTPWRDLAPLGPIERWRELPVLADRLERAAPGLSKATVY
jgi:hypothetical protein